MLMELQPDMVFGIGTFRRGLYFDGFVIINGTFLKDLCNGSLSPPACAFVCVYRGFGKGNCVLECIYKKLVKLYNARYEKTRVQCWFSELSMIAPVFQLGTF